MDKPKFYNIPNTYIPEGKCWKSRGTSIDGFIFAYVPVESNNNILKELYILTIKRSENMDVDPNMMGVPCGFLDWNETLYDAMIREVYEETSLYLPDYKDLILFDNNKRPFFIDSDPTAAYNKRQCVGHHFVIVMDFSKDNAKDFPFHIEQYNSPETSLVKWMKWDDFKTNNFEWSFNHDQKINDAMSFFVDRLTQKL